MSVTTICDDVLVTVTGGQSVGDALIACAVGAEQAGRAAQAKRWFFSPRPTAREVVENAVKGCTTGLDAIGAGAPR